MWITESSIEGVQSEMEEALNALLKKRGCEYKVRFVCFPMETYEEDVAEYLENNSADIIYSNLRVVGDDSNQYYSFYKNGYLQNSASFRGYYVHKLLTARGQTHTTRLQSRRSACLSPKVAVSLFDNKLFAIADIHTWSQNVFCIRNLVYFSYLHTIDRVNLQLSRSLLAIYLVDTC